MSYSLSFSPEFFLAEGEPYDRSDACQDSEGRPASVWSAIIALPDETWVGMAREIFHCDPDYLSPESVLEMIQETDTCSNLNSPVEVWIDPAGDYRIKVWESQD